MAVSLGFAPVGTAGAADYCEFTGIMIELADAVGDVTDYEYLEFAEDLARCLPFYEKTFPYGTAPAQSAGVAGALQVKNPIAAGYPQVSWLYKTPKWKVPTVVTYNPSAANANWRNITGAADVAESVNPAASADMGGTMITTSGTVATIAHILAIHATADARI